MLANDIDPGIVKQNNKRSKKLADEHSFEVIPREWHAKFTQKWTPDHAERTLTRIEQNVFPWLGTRPIKEITAPEPLRGFSNARLLPRIADGLLTNEALDDTQNL